MEMKQDIWTEIFDEPKGENDAAAKRRLRRELNEHRHSKLVRALEERVRKAASRMVLANDHG